MGKADVWLKRSYVTVTSIIVVVSALLLAFTLFSHGYFHSDEEVENVIAGLHGMYALAIVPLVLCSFGLFGACKQKKWALIVFAVGMILAILFMVVCEIRGLTVQPEVDKSIRNQYPESVRLPHEGLMLDSIQVELQCCGLHNGYSDWGNNISKSCLCTKGSTSPCLVAPRDSIHFDTDGVEPVLVYEEPCLQKIIDHLVHLVYRILGIMLGITLLWLLSVVLCIVILCRMNPKLNTPTVVYSPEAKAGNYVTLTDTSELA